MNIADNLEKTATCYFPNNTACLKATGRFTYSEFNQDASRIASGIADSGREAGRPRGHLRTQLLRLADILLSEPSRPGAVVVTFSNHTRPEEFNRIISDCQPRIIFTAEDRIEDLGGRETHPFLELVICDRGDISYNALVEKGEFEFHAIDRNRKGYRRNNLHRRDYRDSQGCNAVP